ncbi:Uma2 family endonuclease [Streptomyces albus subsp. chlorinus]|uniref:Uma2 family endonuclease n=1 Tax=Streptomyces albus TaxID=1888 RepID=UPI001570B115|nr:Uma2 family endonuclease [Streptomyces albus]NSC23609.1 Uma2 family endonuclease [Streptomyces albus subsp. chlorinus]
MRDLLARDGVPEGYKIEVFDGTVIMTPRSPEQSQIAHLITDAARDAAPFPLAQGRVLGNVWLRFPGENDAAPDLFVLGHDAERRGDSYLCVDVLAIADVVSEPDGRKDYVRNVAKYARFGIDLYLIADPFKQLCTLMTEPHATGYAKVKEIPYGEPLTLTLSTGERIEVDTANFPVRD